MYTPVDRNRTMTPTAPRRTTHAETFDKYVERYQKDWGSPELNAQWAGILTRGRRAAQSGKDRKLQRAMREVSSFVHLHEAKPVGKVQQHS